MIRHARHVSGPSQILLSNTFESGCGKDERLGDRRRGVERGAGEGAAGVAGANQGRGRIRQGRALLDRTVRLESGPDLRRGCDDGQQCGLQIGPAKIMKWLGELDRQLVMEGYPEVR